MAVKKKDVLCTHTSVLCYADEIPLSRPKKKKSKGKTPLGKVLPRLKPVLVFLLFFPF